MFDVSLDVCSYDDGYHEMVYEKREDHLTDTEKLWLKDKTTTLEYKKNIYRNGDNKRAERIYTYHR